MVSLISVSLIIPSTLPKTYTEATLCSLPPLKLALTMQS
jgi:hypothetical protein